MTLNAVFLNGEATLGIFHVCLTTIGHCCWESNAKTSLIIFYVLCWEYGSFFCEALPGTFVVTIIITLQLHTCNYHRKVAVPSFVVIKPTTGGILWEMRHNCSYHYTYETIGESDRLWPAWTGLGDLNCLNDIHEFHCIEKWHFEIIYTYWGNWSNCHIKINRFMNKHSIPRMIFKANYWQNSL